MISILSVLTLMLVLAVLRVLDCHTKLFAAIGNIAPFSLAQAVGPVRQEIINGVISQPEQIAIRRRSALHPRTNSFNIEKEE
ncbi:hypothetical protein IQ270_06250 [Microcoleus sp. LEGE 07076]|uniref:hypothetical protein n=1 Tax=Microcoleus sp. LEGE 07076 TaxID=915322 RepID=UPI0018809A2E|nr:hypothetical protein [Microcoleus sp. LEGE 07076]MBE9184332.1 hypothetical protein [Microcoleus sp. LEGE 07076]